MIGRFLRTARFRRHAVALGSVSAVTTFALASALFNTSQKIFADGEADDSSSDDDPGRIIIRRLVTEASTRYGRPSNKSVSAKAEDVLRQYEGSGVIQGDAGVARFDVITVPSGSIKYTQHSLSSVRLSSGNSWTFFGLYDGRNGMLASDYLGQVLIPALLDTLLTAYTNYTSHYDQHVPLEYLPDDEPLSDPLSTIMDKRLKESFLDVDCRMVHDTARAIVSSPSRSDAVIPLQLAQSSSSALVAFYDTDPRLLKLALTGDSRAVVGRATRHQNGRLVYDVHVLTADQDIANQSELSRVQLLHPDEKLLVDGRYLGRNPVFRAFGDAAFKWKLDLQERMYQEYFGDRPLSEVRTPPYVTAEPEVTTFEVKPGDFLVMGTSGLWKSLTNEEVVGLVGLWLESQPDPFNPDLILRPDDASENQEVRVVHREELPIKVGEDHTIMYSRWRSEKKFIAVDHNVATHLARNALGGADRDLMTALLNVHPPFSSRWRSDISATVVFFKDHAGAVYADDSSAAPTTD